MNNWKIILTFTYPYEAHIVKSKLESEDIPTQTRDELTVRSNAIGGVKLLVKEDDYDKALKILIELRQISEPKLTENKLLIRFDKISSKLPLIGKSIVEFRLIIIVALLLVIITAIVSISLS